MEYYTVLTLTFCLSITAYAQRTVVDQKCQYDEHCVEGAFCESQSRCKCKDYYYPNEDGTCSNSSGVEPAGYLILPLLLVVLFATLFIMYLFDFCLRISMINN
ncbi:hypothetical protein NQ317_005502 [Molorchus minor]|uniref:EB domain-containing protein n=1 Tax=Molorchus minor TaxID=1323400 RepID=A0ABQ9IU91_9CUCU|nr:hypothetical protein NQ317_005502 [Molorchus minor]